MSIIVRLLDADVPAVPELRAQLDGALVRQVHNDGTIAIQVPSHAPAAEFSGEIPAWTLDDDLMQIIFILHVGDGRIKGLEMFRGDSDLLQMSPLDATRLQHGWPTH
ncbi:MAG: hypothetical protein ACXVW2_09565 [Nocardioidaceae bacterium]